MTTPAFVSVKTASDLLDGISERVIREAVAAGVLPSARFGRSIRIATADLLAWAESKKAA